jgi:hypothetical protein
MELMAYVETANPVAGISWPEGGDNHNVEKTRDPAKKNNQKREELI